MISFMLKKYLEVKLTLKLEARKSKLRSYIKSNIQNMLQDLPVEIVNSFCFTTDSVLLNVRHCQDVEKGFTNGKSRIYILINRV